MTTTIPRVVVVGDGRLHDPTFRRQLRRFAEPHRRAILAVAALDSRLADLAHAFPAALFKIAVPGDAFDPWPAMLAVVDGRKLPEIAHLLDLPMWTRRLPPQAFQRPLGRLPDGPAFALRIANLLPDADTAATWLDAVREAAHVADAEAALWVAGLTQGLPDYMFRRVCLWIWFSQRPETLGHQLAGDALWAEALGRDEALVRVRRWTERCDFFFELGRDTAGLDPWFEPATIDGHTFRPVTTLAEIDAAARLMRNCALTYAVSLAQGWARLWVATRGTQIVAMIELRRVRGAGPAYAEIGQVRGCQNKPIPRAIMMAVYRWWSGQSCVRLPPPSPPGGDNLGRAQYARWRAFWLPYRKAKRADRPDWLPPIGTAYALEDI
jgi:hypothetical protein